jgi:hypothetical protein
MPFINPDPTYLAQAQRVGIFEDAVADVIDRQSRNEKDSRSIQLQNIRSAATASADILRILHWCEQSGNSNLATVLRLANPGHAEMHSNDLLRCGRLYLIIEVQFQIETLFRNILNALGRNAPKGFHAVAREVLSASGVVNQVRKLELLNVPAFMRNSMHANGVHYGFQGGSTSLTIDGWQFDFVHGQKVACGSWVHVVTALNFSIKVVEEILTSATISSIGLIEDEYSRQKRATP